MRDERTGKVVMEVFFYVLGLLLIVGAILSGLGQALGEAMGAPASTKELAGPEPTPTPTPSEEIVETSVPWEIRNTFIDHPDDLR